MTTHTGTVNFTTNSWTNSLPTIFETNSLADVFFQCEGKRIAVHKTVLASQSPFLKEILSNLEPSVECPVIILEQFRYNVLLLLVDFLYNGRVEGSSNDLITLSKYGKELQIKGLVSTGPTAQPLQLEILEQKRNRVNEQLCTIEDSDVEPASDSDSEGVISSDEDELMIVFETTKHDSSQTKQMQTKEDTDSIHSPGQNQQDVTPEFLKRALSPTSNILPNIKKRCVKLKEPTVCPKEKPTRPQMTKCRMCREVFSCKESLRAHLADKHADKLTCTICGKLFTQRSSLKTHLKNHISKLDNLINNSATSGQLATTSPVKAPVNVAERPVL